ncbi:MAG TPA: hypothetical protein VFW89_04465 [Gemmatimonadaceae bacterium]|nr:hypothetical protein [Gemmatimonadaceae bacterium]
MIADGRERFLREIAERIDPQRIEEIHLFPAIRQGGRETGVAVICATIAPPADATSDATPDVTPAAAPAAAPAPHSGRLTVFRADYRLLYKGRERGKWELSIVEEADAPAQTVDAVVRGVHERAGVEDEPERLDGRAYRAALASALASALWTSSASA